MDVVSEDNNQNDLQEQYLKALDNMEEGQLITGEVIQVDNESVFVDVGYKSDGKIPREEFDEIPTVGDSVSLVLVKKEGRNGNVVVSKRKADQKVFWKVLRDAFDNKEPVTGKVRKSVKGGFEIDLGHGVSAFAPISKMDVFRIENPDEYIGLETKFLVDRLYSDKKVNIVLTRRNWLEQEIERKREEFFGSVQIDDEVEGAVKSFTSFGAFIDLGGFDGLLHINDMSWGHVTRPKDYVKKGQKIKLKVIRLDPEEKKINLSLKHFSEDPWVTFEDRYFTGQKVKGKVTKLTDFGAFIELEEGIEGLAHISELSWVKRINHPKEVLNIGDEVEVMILDYDIPQGRISLGLKQVLPNPWDDLEERFPEGTHLTRTIKKVTNAGAFIELEEGIDGFLHVDDLSWTKRIKHAPSVLKEGEEIEVAVIGVDAANQRIRLGVKQLSDDPWDNLKRAAPKGTIIEGTITSKTDFGLFVKVAGDIEGLIHKNNLSSNRDDDPDQMMEKFNVGDTVKAVVTDLSPSRQKLSLSIKELKLREQKAEISKYIHDEKDEGDGSTFTLADMLKDKDD